MAVVERDPIKTAEIAKARELYFQYLKISYISKLTGVSVSMLQKFAYTEAPDGGECWFNERKSILCDEWKEDNERNIQASSNSAKVAVDFMMRSIQDRSTRKNKKGEHVFLDVYELDTMASMLMKMDRLFAVNQGLRTISLPEHQDVQQLKNVTPTHQVIDTEKVFTALTKDKSMMQKLLNYNKEQTNGKGNTATEAGKGPNHESSHSEGAGEVSGVHISEGLLQQHGEAGDGQPSEALPADDQCPVSSGEADRILELRVSTGPRDRRGTFERVETRSEERPAEGSAEITSRINHNEAMGAKTDQGPVIPDIVDIRETGEIRDGESVYSREPEGGYDDVFEDEFS